ncbi:RHS repeat-associated core domain-containing protein [Anaerohalosphaeraceae bacterium U12dextr]
MTETSPAGTISYGYDANGSLTSKTTSGGTEGYSYDLQGRLRAYTPVTGPSVLYAYDPDGQRIGKTAVTGITEYVVDPYNPTGYSQVLAETTGMTTTCYIHGSDVIGQSVVGASPQYFLYDGHGSVRQLTMSTGLLVGGQDFWYDAWGNELTSNTPLTSYLYCGEQRDGETGLYYLRARMYDPQTGRFTSRDPFVGNGTDPQSLHKYLYCHANPVNGVDPSGMFTLSEIQLNIGTIANLSTRVLNVAQKGFKIKNAIEQASDILRFIRGIDRFIEGVATAQSGAGFGQAVISGIKTAFDMQEFNLSEFMPGMNQMFSTIGNQWNDISRRMLNKIPEISGQVATDPRLLQIVASHALTGKQVGLVFNLPSPPPPMVWTGIPPISIKIGKSEIVFRSAPATGRIFGIEAKCGKNHWQNILRFDYIDFEHGRVIGPHYHIGERADHYEF